jgi:hypothetical protein
MGGLMWNYRVIKKGEEFGLYEVFYNDEGEISAHAESPDLVGESMEDLLASLSLMKKDILRTMNERDRILEFDKIEFKPFCDEEDKTEYPFDQNDLP